MNVGEDECELQHYTTVGGLISLFSLSFLSPSFHCGGVCLCMPMSYRSIYLCVGSWRMAAVIFYHSSVYFGGKVFSWPLALHILARLSS